MTGDRAELVVPGRSASLTPSRHFVRSHVGADVADDRAADIVLVASELVSNAIEHGSGGDITIRVERDDDTVELVVASMSPSLPMLRTEPAAADALRGRGLQIVATLSDAVAIEAAEGVVSVICHFAVGRTADDA